MTDNGKKRDPKKGCLGCLGLIIFFILFGVFVGGDSDNKPKRVASYEAMTVEQQAQRNKDFMEFWNKLNVELEKINDVQKDFKYTLENYNGLGMVNYYNNLRAIAADYKNVRASIQNIKIPDSIEEDMFKQINTSMYGIIGGISGHISAIEKIMEMIDKKTLSPGGLHEAGNSILSSTGQINQAVIQITVIKTVVESHLK